MNKLLKRVAFGILIISPFAFVITVGQFLRTTGFSFNIDIGILNDFGGFVGGVFGSLLTFSSTLLLIYSINKQQLEIDKLKDKEDEKDFYNQLIIFLDLYRSKSRGYLIGDNIPKSNYENQFQYYLKSFKGRYDLLQKKDILKESYFNKDIQSKLNDVNSLNIINEMQTDLIFIFKYVDGNKYGEKYYQILRMFILKEEFIILYFYCLLLLVESKLYFNLENEKFVYNFYKKMELDKYLSDDFFNSIMHDRFLIN
ncbi:hypothetical protein [Chishuiella sp.]|uniref:hypothetical protein n=1 Tax=Chishuiella sp. TaxID=1969467 RepID=UPI0028B1C4F5|nr:hypothetical protein [Chishuiella sp.]